MKRCVLRTLTLAVFLAHAVSFARGRKPVTRSAGLTILVGTKTRKRVSVLSNGDVFSVVKISLGCGYAAPWSPRPTRYRP